MRRKAVWFGLGILLLAGIIFVGQSITPPRSEAKKTSLVGEQYELPNLGFAQVVGDYEWDFPTDYAPHPDYQREEWIFATNSACTYELNLSLRSLKILSDNLAVERESAWAFAQVMTAELRFAENSELIVADVLDSRVTQALAGANEERVWIESWVFDYPNQNFTITGRALEAEFILTLTNPEPQPTSEEWYAYKQVGELNGTLSIAGEIYEFACGVTFTHRFGVAS